MNDLISRQAAIYALGERPFVWNEWADEYDLGQRNQYDSDKLAIETVPSIDAVPVVRCRDCKHYAGEGMYCSQDICVMFDHFYCYYAERKES